MPEPERSFSRTVLVGRTRVNGKTPSAVSWVHVARARESPVGEDTLEYPQGERTTTQVGAVALMHCVKANLSIWRVRPDRDRATKSTHFQPKTKARSHHRRNEHVPSENKINTSQPLRPGTKPNPTPH